jgi:16S rRNA (guanine1207-N2)-methyltransferase
LSSWAHDPERAADALIGRCLDDIDLGCRVLIVNQGGGLPLVLEARGVAFSLWNRRLVPGLAAAPWPPPGPFDLALVRLPKARDEQAMSLDAAASVLRTGARLIVYGGNEEGIRSAAGMLGELTMAAEVIAARGHGRVVAATVPARVELRGALAAWRGVSRVEIAGTARDWVSYPGTFARGRVDEGTALLIGALPSLAREARVLDYACGTGIVAAAVRQAAPFATIDALDNDAVALEALRENAPDVRGILGTSLADAPREVYHVIVSNPPLHDGIAEDHAPLQGLIADAPSHLVSGGMLQMVVQRRVPLDRHLARHFQAVSVVAETGRYRVWRALRT